ncbi:hypothetical protein N0V82_006260 [Gnomoniopsis sp. IMI 355080]|nr:hypothetical protein N0V82_006260 [Gnomoniopsis sp. IMI 355080]
MFSMSTLPDLTPRDSHNLWYTSRHAPTTVPHHLLTTHDPLSAPSHDAAHAHHHPHPRDRDARRALLERTPLARLRHDESIMERRRANVSNYGVQWLKPPGVPKTLFQMREERREAEEHAEAMRREQTMAAQLAEAAAEEDGMMEGEDEEVDLDEDVPEAEGFGFDGEDSEEEEEDTVTESEEEETENNAVAMLVSPVEEAEVRHMRAAEDRLLNFMAPNEDGTSDLGEAFGDADEEREEMLEEDDLVHMQQEPPDADADISMGMDMDMDADLDEGIPEGEEDEYEHTDSDEDVDESTREISFVGRSSGGFMRPDGRQLRRSVHRSSLRSRGSLAQSDMDISGLLSGEGSSFMDSSPHPRRRG